MTGQVISSEIRERRSQWARQLGEQGRGRRYPNKLLSRWNRWLGRLNGEGRDEGRDSERAEGIADMHRLLERR